MERKAEGIILRCVGGFYYVETADAVYTCRGRGVLRRKEITPLAGDRAVITVGEDGTGALEEIKERRNSMVRPAVANVDLLVLVASVREPVTNPLVLDKMIAVAEKKDICPLLVFNKSDIEDPRPLSEIYEKAGLECFTVCARQPETVEKLRERLDGKISVFTGHSGVGKSSLLNAIDPSLQLETGCVSARSGRGRHTTRTASLYRLAGGYVADTPGFTSIELMQMENIGKDELAYWFREFRPLADRCRFSGCMHYKEPGCAVRQAVDDGIVSPSRYRSYVTMFESVKDRKEWENP